MQLTKKTNRRGGWKSVSIALALGASTLAVSLPAMAQGINVFVNGNTVNFGGVPPTSQGGRVLVPLRGVFEALGAVVDYNAGTRTIDALRGDTRLKITLGSTIAFVNDQPVRLEVPAQTSLGRTLVPLRFVGEALGAQVQWDAGQRAVIITSPEVVNPLPTPTPRPTPRPTPIPDPIDPDPIDPDPIDPGVEDNTVSGSVVRINNAQRAITIRSNNISRTYQLARNAMFERQPLLNRSTLDNPEFGSATTILFTEILAGDTVLLTLNDDNLVTRVASTPSVYIARVRSSSGGRITLDDDANTQLNIGTNLRFINSQGRAATTSNLRAGDEVVLFISPDTRRIYQVSSYRNDLNAANGLDATDPYLPPDNGDPNTDPNNGDTPQIDQVTFTILNQNQNNNANQDLMSAKAGDTISVVVRGTPGLRGTFELGNRNNAVNLRERPNRAGEYTGNYVVRPGDDILQGRVTVRLTGRNGQIVTEQSQDDITIDTVAPRIVGTYPANNETINNNRPNITIYTDDLGGSGLAPSTITITNNGQTFEADATVAQMTLRAVSPRTLSGRVQVRAEVIDEAGNTATSNFSFTVRGGDNGPINSIFHNANRVLQAGDVLTVDMDAEAGGRATFDLQNANGDTVSQGNAMTEIGQGRYRGTYSVRERDGGQLRVIGRFRNADGQTTTSEAGTTVEVAGGTDANLTALTITSPVEGDRVNAQTTVRGRGTSGNIVDVSIRAEGTQYYVFEYKEEIGTAQVRVRNNGVWETQALNLPAPRNVTGLRYVITVTQTDGAGRVSEPVTVTLRPQQ